MWPATPHSTSPVPIEENDPLSHVGSLASPGAGHGCTAITTSSALLLLRRGREGSLAFPLPPPPPTIATPAIHPFSPPQHFLPDACGSDPVIEPWRMVRGMSMGL